MITMLTAYVVSHLESRKAARNDEGAAAVEYGLLVGLISVAIIATVLLLGTQLNTLFTAVTDQLAAVIPA